MWHNIFVTFDYSKIDLFIAARENDVGLLRAALMAGQSLSAQRPENGYTPLHTAALNGSADFIREALNDPTANPWLRNRLGHLPIDLADASGHRAITRMFYDAMYPDGRVPFPEEP